MSEVILKFSGVSKKFCRKSSTSIYYGLKDIIKSFFGLEICKDLRADEFWALSDVSFDLRRGECLGIVGANGAGKSTLLKIVSKLLIPEKGEVNVSGRVCSLLEVSSGFHPKLTGRENIYIRGQILGLSNQQINEQMDSIIEFSGIEDFIDSPIKSYSSGMNARLGFAIAAHVDADLLILDEVLAVGDMSFRMKCLQYLKSIKQDTAIILVSHNMQIISRICDEAFHLDNGQLIHRGEPDIILDQYAKMITNKRIKAERQLTEIISRCDVNANTEVQVSDDYEIHLDLETSLDVKAIVNVSIHRDDGLHCFGLLSEMISCQANKANHITLNLSQLSLMPAEYYINVIVFEHEMISKLAVINYGLKFRVNGDFKIRGIYQPDFNWNYS